MMTNEPIAPYDQNELSNHKISIAKTKTYFMNIERPLLTREHTYDIFQNIASNHGHKPRSSRAKPN
jgi:hypothetical protein